MFDTTFTIPPRRKQTGFLVNKMKVLDPGHQYRLATLDGEREVILTFVKRNNPPEKYPGNSSAYAGTTMQEVMRCLIDRLKYVDQQKPNPINTQIISLLRLSIWLLEARAAEHKSKFLEVKCLEKIEEKPTKAEDGHLEVI